MKEFFFNFGYIIFFVVSLYLEFFGLYHSYDKHDGLTALLLPPVAWYNAVEYWWHSDEDLVNFDQKNIVYFIHNYSLETDPDYNEQLLSFKERYSNYKKEDAEFLKKFGRVYIFWRESQINDLVKTLSWYTKGEKFDFSYTDKTKVLENQVSEYELGKKLVDYENESLKDVIDEFNNKMEELSMEDIEYSIEEIERTYSSVIKFYKLAFTEMFGEKF